MTSDRDHTDHEASASGGPPLLLTTLRRLFGPAGPSPVLCRMRYAVNDPFAVALDLFGDLDMDVCVTWVVARDLLAGGTPRPSGEGDFRVRPSYRRTGEPARLRFSLIGPRGHVTFEADLDGRPALARRHVRAGPLRHRTPDHRPGHPDRPLARPDVTSSAVRRCPLPPPGRMPGPDRV